MEFASLFKKSYNSQLINSLNVFMAGHERHEKRLTVQDVNHAVVCGTQNVVYELCQHPRHVFVFNRDYKVNLYYARNGTQTDVVLEVTRRGQTKISGAWAKRARYQYSVCAVAGVTFLRYGDVSETAGSMPNICDREVRTGPSQSLREYIGRCQEIIGVLKDVNEKVREQFPTHGIFPF